MTTTTDRTLQDELCLAGASAHQAAELATLAGQLKSLKTAPQATTKTLFEPLVPPARSRFKLYVLPAFSFLMIVAVLLTFAQSSLPGSLLYPVKRASENTVAFVDPGFKATMMMRRAQEINDLVATHAPAAVVVATLEDYRSDVQLYRVSDTSVLKYCTSKLQAAAAIAPDYEKRVILKTLVLIGTS